MMETQVLATDLYNWKDAAQQAADALLDGQVVALPTETVYGLAACISNEEAIKAVFDAKERPSYDPLIVHLGSLADLDQVALIDDELRPVINKLADQFWPGPLTLVLPKQPHVSDLVTSGLPTVAVRISAHEIMQEVCKLTGPLAAPSANRFGRISPTSASAVVSELDGRIPLVIDGGACRDGIESTIIKPSPAPAEGKKPIYTLLRPGAVTREELRKIGKIEKVKPPRKDAPQPAPDAVQAPGMLDSHYSPVTPLYLYDNLDDFTPEEGKRYGLFTLKGEDGDYFDKHEWDSVVTLSPGSGKVAEGAVRFYWAMRKLDELQLDAIIAEPMHTANVGEALMDRLKRAAVNL